MPSKMISYSFCHTRANTAYWPTDCIGAVLAQSENSFHHVINYHEGKSGTNPLIKVIHRILTMFTQPEIKEILHYDRDSGVFTWLIKPSVNTNVGAVAGCTTSLHGKKYCVISIKNKGYLAHRLAWLYITGSWPSVHIDHADGDGTNNIWTNLTEATQAVNAKNRRRNSNNSSGVAGVHWYKTTSRWLAKICANKNQEHLGYFNERWDAICARKSAEHRHGFHVNHGMERSL